MDLLEDEPELNLHDSSWKVYSVNPAMPPHYVSPEAKVKKSLISEGAVVYGEVENSVIFSGVKIAKGAKVINSVVLPFTHIKEGACVDKAVVGQNCEIGKGAVVKATDGSITVVPEGEVVQSDAAKQVG